MKSYLKMNKTLRLISQITLYLQYVSLNQAGGTPPTAAAAATLNIVSEQLKT